MPARWVVVVPTEDTALFAYLTTAFASIRDVKVVMERRRGRAADEAAVADDGAADRRAPIRVVSNFGCAVVRRPEPVVAAAPTTAHRTLLWPNLRITDVLGWAEDPAPGV